MINWNIDEDPEPDQKNGFIDFILWGLAVLIGLILILAFAWGLA